MKRLLPRITLIAADTINPAAAVISLRKSMELCQFGDVVLFTHVPLELDGIRVVQIPQLEGKDGYSKFIIKELHKHFHTDFVLVTQADSWVLDAGAWADEFMDYSYIGAPWLETDQMNCGNGGFSLRSRELQVSIGTDPMIQICTPEDNAICKLYRPYLEKTYGFRWPSDDLADRFSFELREPVGPTFGFHSFFHTPYTPTTVIERRGGLGDVLAVEPVIRAFQEMGHRVYLKTAYPGLFPDVPSPDSRDQRVPATTYNLDLSYEVVPDRNHVQAYFDFCGLTQIPSPPKLDRVGDKPFQRYAVIHIDARPQPSRNVYGVDWDVVVMHLEERGYTVIQIGSPDKKTKATWMNVPGEFMLMWLVGWADLFVGIDSGPANIAVACGVSTCVFAGSVDMEKIHLDLSLVEVIEKSNVCDTPKCWHSVVSTEGQKCVVDEAMPPCVQFKTGDVIKAINRWIGER